jgi:hypothetical protein
MNLLDFLELWFESLRGFFQSINISIVLTRTEDNRPNHSCSVTLRGDDIEIDFIAWESGLGEFAITRNQGDFSEEHLDDLNNKLALAVVLAKIIEEVIKKKGAGGIKK